MAAPTPVAASQGAMARVVLAAALALACAQPALIGATPIGVPRSALAAADTATPLAVASALQHTKVALGASASETTNVCDLHWVYCPRDPGCTGYTMSVDYVEVHAPGYNRAVYPANMSAGDEVRVVAHGFTSLAAVPVHGTYKIYDLVGGYASQGTLHNDTLRIYDSPPGSPSPHAFTLTIAFPLEDNNWGYAQYAQWFEFGIDVFMDKSASDEAVCLEVMNTDYLDYSVDNPSPPFVMDCADDGDGHFTHLATPAPIGEAPSFEMLMLRGVASAEDILAFEAAQMVGEYFSGQSLAGWAMQSPTFTPDSTYKLDGASAPVLAFLGAIETFTNSFMSTFVMSVVHNLLHGDNATLTGDVFADALCETEAQSASLVAAVLQPVAEALHGAGGTVGAHAVIAGGAGAGFGVQIMCRGETMLTVGTGAGFSLAFNTSNYGWATSLGGGGGMQGFAAGGAEQYFGIGGGGSGNTTHAFVPSPSADDGAVSFGGVAALRGFATTAAATAAPPLPSGQCQSSSDPAVFTSMSASALARRIRESCPHDQFQIVGGGGGGGGVSVDGVGMWCNTEFGGGWGYAFGDTDGPGGGGTPDTNQGLAISDTVNTCRLKCMPTGGASSGPGADFYATCMCPCMQAGFMGQGLPWAQQMQCPPAT